MAELNSVLELIKDSPVPVSICDGQSRVVVCNKAFSDMSGRTIDELVGETPRQFLSGEKTSDAELQRIGERVTEGTPFDFAFEAYRNSGETFFLSVFSIPFVDGKDSVPYVVSICCEKDELGQPLLENAPPEFKLLIGQVLSMVQAS